VPGDHATGDAQLALGVVDGEEPARPTADGKAGPGDANDAKNTIFSVDPRGEREGAPAGESEETPLAKEYENGVIGVTGVTAAKSQNTETPADAQAPVGDEEIGPCIRFTIDGQEPPEMITLKV